MSFRQIRCVTHACYLCASETEAFCSVIGAPAGARRRFSVSTDASPPKQQDFQNESPPAGKSTCLLFGLADHHTTFFPSCLFSSPPRPSPGSLHYSDEDVSAKYNDLIPAESSSLTEKPSEISDSQVSQRRKKTNFESLKADCQTQFVSIDG